MVWKDDLYFSFSLGQIDVIKGKIELTINELISVLYQCQNQMWHISYIPMWQVQTNAAHQGQILQLMYSWKSSSSNF